MKYWEYLLETRNEPYKDKEHVKRFYEIDLKYRLIELKEDYTEKMYNGIKCYTYNKSSALALFSINRLLASSDQFGFIAISMDLIEKISKSIGLDISICLNLIIHHEVGHNLFKFGEKNPDYIKLLNYDIKKEAFMSSPIKEIVADKYSLIYSNASKDEYIQLREGLNDLVKRYRSNMGDNYKYNYDVLYDTKDNPLDYQSVLDKS